MTNNLLLPSYQKSDWLTQLAEGVTSPDELLQMLGLEDNQLLLEGKAARKLFPLRVPKGFISRMQPKNPVDPLLLQILTSQQEFIEVTGFSTDPLGEQQNAVPGLLHKYKNRVLLLVKAGCAINCRYCFRRHFPYAENQGNKQNWLRAIDYIAKHPELNEVIFSGGDPLMAKDPELIWLLSALESIPHIKRIRIHSRLPIVIPARITDELVDLFQTTSLQVILVNHINHPNEINQEFRDAMLRLRQVGVTLLNHSVLLRGVNDSAEILASLSNALFDAHVLPYYLFTLDRVTGAAHFMVEDNQAKKIMHELLSMLSGYLVPRLVREIRGEPSKTPLDLGLTQQ